MAERLGACILRPPEHPQSSLKTLNELQQTGPQETQAGAINALSTTIAVGFIHHPGAFEPDGAGTIRYYAHIVDCAHKQ
jgi:hypothetical protein